MTSGNWTYNAVSGRPDVIETINDHVGGARGNGIIKPVVHNKVNVSWSPFRERTTKNPYCPSHGYSSCTPTGVYAPNAYGSLVQKWESGWSWGSVPYPNTAPPSSESFRAASMRQLAELMPRKVSVANFLLELGDVEQVLKSAAKLRNLDRSILGKTPRQLARKRKRAGRLANKLNDLGRDLKQATGASLKTASDLTLAYDFGVKPFIQDLDALLDIQKDVQKRVAYLKKTSGKRVTVRRKRVTPIPNSVTIQNNIGPGGFGSTFSARTTISNHKIVEVVGATSYQDFPLLINGSNQLALTTRALGLDRPLSIIWEGIPFSFLVDWVVDVGKVMDGFSLLPSFEGAIGLSNPWYSFKREYDFKVEVYDKVTLSYHTMCQGKAVQYSRALTFSLGGGTSIDSSLNENQVRDLLALLIQRGL